MMSPSGLTQPSANSVVLVVDDDEGLLVLMTETLRAEGHTVIMAESWKAALACVREKPVDLMLLDLKLKDVAGPALLQRLKDENILVPFIVVTGQGDERIAVEVMKQGALDYVMKDGLMLDLLPTIVKRALTAVARDHALEAADQERVRLERRIIEVGEREQHRIGEDLHDGLGQQLTAIEMLCTSLKADVVTAAPQLACQVEKIAQRLRETIAQTRSMARGLVPVSDEPEALWASLVELAEQTNSIGRLRCRFDCPDPISVENNAVAGHLYRIAQEAVNNAVKYSKAREVVISLVRRKPALELRISDNGSGLSPSKSRGMGLQVMKHRASVIGAQLTVDSKPGRGVTITCILPHSA